MQEKIKANLNNLEGTLNLIDTLENKPTETVIEALENKLLFIKLSKEAEEIIKGSKRKTLSIIRNCYKKFNVLGMTTIACSFEKILKEI